MDNYFLKLVGIKQLSAPAQSTAVEGVANIEVSLVVDISGSMGWPIYGAPGVSTRIEALRGAAKLFVRTLLQPEYDGKISISLIPYSENVNIGPLLSNQLMTTRLHNYSHCIDLDESDFRSPSIDTAKVYDQSQHFQYNSTGFRQNLISDPVCPHNDYERIIPWSTNLGQLEAQIEKLQPRAGTAIYAGMKWATALLDPSTRPLLNTLIGSSDVDPGLAGRPFDYPTEGMHNAPQKVIVLMTDGQNSLTHKLRPQYYDTVAEREFWAANNFWYAFYYRRWMRPRITTNHYYQRLSSHQGDYFLDRMCTIAKDNGIMIFAVSVEAQVHGQRQMAQCASSPAHFFHVQGSELTDIFQTIAKQISDLRLTL